MSSGSSGRYQSKLFNFVHQQSRRLTERWEHSFRQIQVATKWGVEVLLYPVYLLFGSSESDGKTLHTKEPQFRLKLQSNDSDFQSETPLTVDSPIQHVLETIYDLSSEEAMSTTGYAYANSEKASEPFKPLSRLGVFWRKSVYNNLTNNAHIIQSLTITENKSGSLNPSQLENVLKQHLPIVRGIATSLVNRNLVLVSADNEILDILTPQQQAKLEDRIINEVANYWQYWRLNEAKKSTNLLPEINRLLAKLTGESTAKIPVLAEGIPKDLVNSHRLLAFLDIAVAKLESNSLVPVQEHSQEIIRAAHNQLSRFLYGKEQLADNGKIAVDADGLETHTLNFQALIEAALNYFFGVGSSKKFEPTTTDHRLGKLLPHHSRKALSKSRELPKPDLKDEPWLMWNDLFSDKPVTLSPRTNPALASSPSLRNLPQKNFNVQPKVQSGLVQRKKPTRNLASIPKTSTKVASVKQTEASISQLQESRKGKISQQQFRQSSQVEAQPDWIETKATATGYEKHPLEQLLEWLDYAMLWLEERFVRIFQSLQQLLQGK